MTIKACHGYTGYTADNVTGTYFAQAREYMPQVGRFNGVDIILKLHELIWKLTM